MIYSLMLAAAALVVPSTAKIVGNWTLADFGLSCSSDAKSCSYEFAIRESYPGEPAPTDWARCSFVVTQSPDSLTLANETDFGPANCSESASHVYQTQAGWNGKEYVVLTVTNTEKQYDAFFAFQTADINADSRSLDPQVSPAYEVGTFNLPARTRARPRRSLSTFPSFRRDIHPVGDGATWTVRSLVRHIDSSSNEAQFSFVLDGDTVLTCYLQIEGTDEEVKKLSWYDHDCEQNGYHISWGLDGLEKAVLNVQNPNRTRQAWFGFTDINANDYVGDSGPFKVYTV